MKKIRFLLIGPGKVGVSLAAAWVRAGHRCIAVEGGDPRRRGLASRRLRAGKGRVLQAGAVPPFQLALIAVPDRHVAAVARSWAGRLPWKGRVALHTSGALEISVLEPLRRRGAHVGCLHPLLSLSRRELGRNVFLGSTFGVQGDGAAVRIARRMAREAGGRPLTVREGGKALYHLGACLASGYLLGLIDAAGRLAGDPSPAGLRKALLHLASSTLRNANRRGLEASLTGPILRGDLVALRAHLRALENLPREWSSLHRTLALHTLDVARRSDRVSPRTAARMRRIFAGRP